MTFLDSRSVKPIKRRGSAHRFPILRWIMLGCTAKIRGSPKRKQDDTAVTTSPTSKSADFPESPCDSSPGSSCSFRCRGAQSQGRKSEGGASEDAQGRAESARQRSTEAGEWKKARQIRPTISRSSIDCEKPIASIPVAGRENSVEISDCFREVRFIVRRASVRTPAPQTHARFQAVRALSAEMTSRAAIKMSTLSSAWTPNVRIHQSRWTNDALARDVSSPKNRR
jgi:hypothetical protein